MNMTFPPMRRIRQQLNNDDTANIFEHGTHGTLALLGDDAYPYAVPVSYVFAENKIIFHGAKSGHKMNAILRSPKASFCVIEKDDIHPETYTTYFRSAIAFGKIRLIEDEPEKSRLCEILAEKYRPGFAEERKAAIRREWNALAVFALEIEHMTGKEAIELVRKNE